MKHGIVFGASGMLGQSLCQSLVQENKPLFGTYWKNESTAGRLQQLGVKMVQCDVSQEQNLIDMADELDEITFDSLVISLGAWPVKTGIANKPTPFDSLTSLSLDAINEVFQINTISIMMICKTWIPALQRGCPSNIVILGSLNGHKAIPSPAHFSASKAALKGLVEALAKELGKDDICVNLVCPGLIDCPKTQALDKSLVDAYLEHSVLGRLATADEIAEVITWLTLENTYISGQSILLDGGL